MFITKGSCSGSTLSLALRSKGDVGQPSYLDPPPVYPPSSTLRPFHETKKLNSHISMFIGWFLLKLTYATAPFTKLGKHLCNKNIVFVQCLSNLHVLPLNFLLCCWHVRMFWPPNRFSWNACNKFKFPYEYDRSILLRKFSIKSGGQEIL